MSNILKLKILSIIAVVLASVYFIVGLPRSRNELLSNLRTNIRLGLDLRGGIDLILRVHLRDAIDAKALKPAEEARRRTEVMNQTLHVIERKVNALGVSEATAQLIGSHEDSEILVEIPGVDDSARIKRILTTAAALEWRDVKDGPFPNCGSALASRGGLLPLNTQLVEGTTRGDRSLGCYLLAKNSVIRGSDIRNAQPAQSPLSGGWVTTFTLSQDVAPRFEAYTQANINNRAASVLDGKIVSVATIINRIRDTGQITGLASFQEASELALNLRTGSLPARIDIAGEHVVGPSLGADSIRQGMRAGAAGLAAVLTVMCTYYKGAGINATVALLLNALILVATLSHLDAVLTLPGIAGVILTIGMAVDSKRADFRAHP